MTNPACWPSGGVQFNVDANYSLVFVDLSYFNWTTDPDPHDSARLLCHGRVYPDPVKLFSGADILFVLGYAGPEPSNEVVGVTGLRYMQGENMISANPFEHGGNGEFVLETPMSYTSKMIWVLDKHDDTADGAATYEYMLMLRRSVDGGVPVAYTFDPTIENEPE
ncbi:MAG: hypothetical protein HKN15_11485 [Xanthomonadales bacterium]|nr:hypothetical protein [Xanthomonadales bacterium]